MILFEFSDADAIDDDVAVQATEQMAAELQLLDSTARAAFCRQPGNVARSYSREHAEFIRELPETLNLG